RSSSVLSLRLYCFFFSSRRRHTRSKRDWSSDVCSSDLLNFVKAPNIIRTSGLGSCVGVVVYDLARKTAGLAHIMLPDSKQAKQRSEERRVGKECKYRRARDQ